MRQQRHVVVKEKYPKKVTEDTYIYEELNEDQKKRFGIWLRIQNLQDRWHKTHRISWSEADRLLEAANNYMAQKVWRLTGVTREKAYMDCLRALGKQDENAFVFYVDHFRGALHYSNGLRHLWGEEKVEW